MEQLTNSEGQGARDNERTCSDEQEGETKSAPGQHSAWLLRLIAIIDQAKCWQEGCCIQAAAAQHSTVLPLVHESSIYISGRAKHLGFASVGTYTYQCMQHHQ